MTATKERCDCGHNQGNHFSMHHLNGRKIRDECTGLYGQPPCLCIGYHAAFPAVGALPPLSDAELRSIEYLGIDMLDSRLTRMVAEVRQRRAQDGKPPEYPSIDCANAWCELPLGHDGVHLMHHRGTAFTSTDTLGVDWERRDSPLEGDALPWPVQPSDAPRTYGTNSEARKRYEDLSAEGA